MWAGLISRDSVQSKWAVQFRTISARPQAGPRGLLFRCDVDEMLRSFLLTRINEAVVKLVSFYVVSLEVTEPTDGLRCGLTVFRSNYCLFVNPACGGHVLVLGR